jgi:hypothetical protein
VAFSQVRGISAKSGAFCQVRGKTQFSAKFASWWKIANAKPLHTLTLECLVFVLSGFELAIFSNDFVLVESTKLAEKPQTWQKAHREIRTLCGLLFRGAKEFVSPPPPSRE